MNKPVGGRGKQASYKSTHVRIPEPIKVRVEELKELFFSGELENYDKLQLEKDRVYNEYLNSLTGKNDDNEELISLEEALVMTKKLLRQKKSVKYTIAKLLTGIYGVEIDPTEL